MRKLTARRRVRARELEAHLRGESHCLCRRQQIRADLQPLVNRRPGITVPVPVRVRVRVRVWVRVPVRVPIRVERLLEARTARPLGAWLGLGLDLDLDSELELELGLGLGLGPAWRLATLAAAQAWVPCGCDAPLTPAAAAVVAPPLVG